MASTATEDAPQSVRDTQEKFDRRPGLRLDPEAPEQYIAGMYFRS